MDDKLFQKLVQSAREMGAIMRGEIQPARAKEFPIPKTAPYPNPKSKSKLPKSK